MFRNEKEETKMITDDVDSVAPQNAVCLHIDSTRRKHHRKSETVRAHRSALLLASDDLGLGGTLDLLALALELLGHLSGSFLRELDDFVLLKVYSLILSKKKSENKRAIRTKTLLGQNRVGLLYSKAIVNSTYPSDVSLRVVLLSSIDIVVDSDESTSAATTELGLDAEHSDPILSSLELLADGSLDVGSLDVANLGVKDINSLDREMSAVRGRQFATTYHLLSAEKGVHDDLLNVKSKLSVCHFYLY